MIRIVIGLMVTGRSKVLYFIAAFTMGDTHRQCRPNHKSTSGQHPSMRVLKRAWPRGALVFEPEPGPVPFIPSHGESRQGVDNVTSLALRIRAKEE
jgi:hypothetical protein